MIYKFLCLNRIAPQFTLQTLCIHADNEQEARFSLSADYRLLALIARINPLHLKNSRKNTRTLPPMAQAFLQNGGALC